MRSIVLSFTLTVVVIHALSLQAGAQNSAPPNIPVQGYLTDDGGEPLDGNVDIIFSIYEVGVGGEALFSELQDVSVENGNFTAYIGDKDVLDLALFRDHENLFIGIKVNDNDEAKPRIQLATAPYAGFSEFCGDAMTLDGMSVADLLNWDNIEGIPDNIINSESTTIEVVEGGGLAFDDEGQLAIAGDSVTTQQILDGTITSEDVDTDDFAIKTGSKDQSFDDATLYLDYGEDRVGIRTDDPQAALDVNGAVRATEYLLSNPRMASRYVGAEEFQPDYSSNYQLGLMAGNSVSGNYLFPPYRLTNAAGGVAVAPVHLPNGAEIRGVSCYFFDNNASYDIKHLTMRLLSTSHDCFEDSGNEDDNCVNTLAVVDPPESEFLNLNAEGMKNHTVDAEMIEGNPVNNQEFRYGMHLYFNSSTPGRMTNLRFYGCKLDYEVFRLSP